MDPAGLFTARTPWLLATGIVCFGTLFSVLICSMLVDLWRWRQELKARRARTIGGVIFGAACVLCVYGAASYYVTISLAKQLLFVWE